MTSEQERGVYYKKYYGQGGGGCQVAAGCKNNVQGKGKRGKKLSRTMNNSLKSPLKL